MFMHCLTYMCSVCIVFDKMPLWYFSLLFELHFLIHLAPLMHFFPCSYLLFFLSFLLIHLSIRDKKGESIPECIVISIWLTCTFIGRKSHKCDAYTKGEKTFFYQENLVLFCFTLCLFSRCFMTLWVMFSIYTLLLLSHNVFVLDMHTSLC